MIPSAAFETLLAGRTDVVAGNQRLFVPSVKGIDGRCTKCRRKINKEKNGCKCNDITTGENE